MLSLWSDPIPFFTGDPILFSLGDPILFSGGNPQVTAHGHFPTLSFGGNVIPYLGGGIHMRHIYSETERRGRMQNNTKGWVPVTMFVGPGT